MYVKKNAFSTVTYIKGDCMEFIGFLGVLLIQVSMLPQIYRTYKTRSAKDVDLAYLTILLIGLALLLSYAISITDLVFIVGNTLSFTFTLIELVGVYKWRHVKR